MLLSITMISEVDIQESPHKMTFRVVDKQYMACLITLRYH